MAKAYIQHCKVIQVKEKGAMYEIRKKIHTPDDIYLTVKEVTHIQDEAQEVFGIFILDRRNHINAVYEISRGTVCSSFVHPREVFKPAILHNASGIILFHNHPGGDPFPSPNDITITKRLVECGEIFGIDIMDHIIVGDEEVTTPYVSLKARGLM